MQNIFIGNATRACLSLHSWMVVIYLHPGIVQSSVLGGIKCACHVAAICRFRCLKMIWVCLLTNALRFLWNREFFRYVTRSSQTSASAWSCFWSSKVFLACLWSCNMSPTSLLKWPRGTSRPGWRMLSGSHSTRCKTPLLPLSNNRPAALHSGHLEHTAD
jgi:hypothetical protein